MKNVIYDGKKDIKEIRRQFIRDMQELGHYIPIYYLKLFKEKGLI